MRIKVSAKNQAHTFECEAGERILLAGLRHGVALPYECGTGTCGTCKARLVEGELDNRWPEAPGQAKLRSDRGEFLMCQSATRGDCSLEVGALVSLLGEDACVPVNVDAVVAERTFLTHDVASIRLDLSRPLDFEAGQFVLMTVGDVAGARAYSMVNFDRKAVRLWFVVKNKPDGRLSEWLFGRSVEGTRVGLFGPLGAATFRPDMDKNLLCIAGGSGIAGMMSIVSRATQECYFERHSADVFFGVRTPRDVFFLDELAGFQTQVGDALRVTVAFSDEGVDPALAARYPSLAFATGFIHAVAGERMQGRFGNVRAYAAGPPPMVDATLRMLLLQGKLRSDNIRYDKFS